MNSHRFPNFLQFNKLYLVKRDILVKRNGLYGIFSIFENLFFEDFTSELSQTASGY